MVQLHDRTSGDRWNSPSASVDPIAERRHRSSGRRRSKAPLVIGTGLALVIAGGAAVWLLRPELVSELRSAIAPADEPAVDPELQAMVDDWRDRDATTATVDKPSRWAYGELVKLREHRDTYRAKLLALEADYTRNAELMRKSSDAGTRDRARMDATLAAEQAKPVRAEVARTVERIATMEQDLGLSPGQVLEY